MALAVECTLEAETGSILTDRNEVHTSHVNVVQHHSVSLVVHSVYDTRETCHVQFGFQLINTVNQLGHDGQCIDLINLGQSFLCSIGSICESNCHIVNHIDKNININFGYINQRVSGVFHCKRCREELNVCTLTNDDFVEDIRELLNKSVLSLYTRNSCCFHYKSFQLASQCLAEVGILHVKV